MKRYSISFLVLVFLFSFSIAKASVTTDAIKVQYDSCVRELAVKTNAAFPMPDPNDPAFHSSISNITYEQALGRYNLQKVTLDKLKDTCESLASQVGTQNTQIRPALFPTNESEANGTPATMQDVYNKQVEISAKIDDLKFSGKLGDLILIAVIILWSTIILTRKRYY